MVSFRDQKIQTFWQTSSPLSYVESPPHPQPAELCEGDIFEITVVCLLLYVLGSAMNIVLNQFLSINEKWQESSTKDKTLLV